MEELNKKTKTTPWFLFIIVGILMVIVGIWAIKIPTNKFTYNLQNIFDGYEVENYVENDEGVVDLIVASNICGADRISATIAKTICIVVGVSLITLGICLTIRENQKQ